MGLWLLAILFAGGSLLLFSEQRRMPDGRLHVSFLDVGQGDSALIVTPSGKQIVIDGGPDFRTLEQIGERMPFFDRTIELLVLSHPNLDHLAALPEVLRRYRVRRFLLTGVRFDLPRYAMMLDVLKRQGIPIVLADPRQDIDFGDRVLLDIIWPPASALTENQRDINDTSIVLRVLYGEESILFTGDIEESAERAILVSGADIRAKILKVAHHGSRTGTSTGFLLAVRPKIAVISVGAKNTYGHPRKEILERLETFGAKILRTDIKGTIAMVFE